MCLMRHSFTICHVPSKFFTQQMYFLDHFHQLAKSDDCEAEKLETSAELFISTVVPHLPATHNCLKAYSTPQSENKSLQQV